MSAPYLVALQGFSAFERSALGSYFRLAANRTPSYEQSDNMADCQFVVADADHAGVVQAIVQAGRVDDTVFIGARPPENASAWMMRPIDPLHVQRELDAMVAAKAVERPLPGSAAAASAAPRPLTWAAGRSTAAGPVPARRAGDSGDRGSFRLGDIKPAAPSPSEHGRDALLVDDSEIALRFLETRLQRQGLHTQRATTSGKAIELLSKRAFDLVFLDVELGSNSELDGLALCRHIKRQHRPAGGGPAPIVVMLSAHHGELDRVRGMLAGCDAYLTKPLDPAALQGLLAQHGAAPPVVSGDAPAG